MKKIINRIVIVSICASFGLASCTTEDLNADKRDDYTGNWLCHETSSQLGTSQYTVSISKSITDSNEIFISNFYNLGSSKKATAIVDGNSITIYSQLVDNLNVAGSGTLNGSQINLNYTVSAGGTDNVTAVYTQ